MRLFNFVATAALLVPVIQFASGLKPLSAAQSSEDRQIPEGFEPGELDRWDGQIPGALGMGQSFRLETTREPWDLYAPEIVKPVGAQQGVEPLSLLAEPLQVLAQTNSPSDEAEQLLRRGFQQYNRSQFREAIASWEEALERLRSMGNRQAEGVLLNALSYAYLNLSQYEQAIILSEEAIDIARDIGHLEGEGNALDSLGEAHFRLSQYEQAIDFHEQALAIFHEIGNLDGKRSALINLGNVYARLGQYERTIDFYEQSLEIAREIGDRNGEARTLNNLGEIYRNLGQYERTIHLYEQSLVLFRDLGDRTSESVVLGNLGLVYNNLGQYQRAIDFFGQSLAIARELGGRAEEGGVLTNLGFTYAKLGQYQRAIEFFEQSLVIAREVGDRAGEGFAIANLGFAYNSQKQYEQAIEFYGQALAIFRELGTRAQEGIALSYIGQSLNDQQHPELAILFLKASVDVREEIRGDIRGLSNDLQQSFTDIVADDYRLLADLLLQQNRIIEAQRVLDLLKIQELDDYLKDLQRNAQTETGVDFWQPEERILALYQDTLLAGTELSQLQSRNPNSLSRDEQARLAELTAQQEQLYTSFVDWLTHPEIVASIDDLRVETRSRTVDIENFTDLQDQLAQLPQASVILYPLILEDRLELVLVSADAPPVRYPVNVDAVTLNRAIVAFGQAIKDWDRDARGPAQQLYDWVIAPLEADLAALGTENIIFAPDGALRYVPLAALYDGDQWLVERFSFSQITAASETDFAAVPRDRQSLLAAACANCAFTVEVGEDTFAFGDLPATRQEVDILATQIPEVTVLIDSNFTPQQFKDQLGNHNWIHLATHGLFVADNPDASFLLFGNGETVNLRQVFREWQQMDADLVVLSACETALGGPELGSGIEVLGLGFQMQRVGAKAVMASLWVVSDQGTQALMEHFYAALNQGMTKAEALQMAQLAMMRGSQVAIDDGERSIAVVANSSVDESAVRRAANYSHPYYWAPFILIGNGL